MIELLFGGILYGATLLNCYDGDTCRIRFTDTNPIVATQGVRLSGFDTPEIRGKCRKEKELALEARDFTRNYISSYNGHWTVLDVSDRYGRIVVRIDGLADALVARGLARYYNGGKRQSWCK